MNELLTLLIVFVIGWLVYRFMMRSRENSGATRSTSQGLIARIQGDGQFALDVVGESHYQDELDRIAGGKTKDGHQLEKEAMLIYDDQNAHDPQAVAVSIGGEIVGHLSREDARLYRKKMKESGGGSAPGVCRAMIVGGWKRSHDDEGNYGVKLDIPIR